MLKMRLQKRGRKNDPHSRVIITDARQGPKSGKYVEIVGSYDMKAGTIEINKDRASHWLTVGAQPSVTVHNMLVKEGIIDAPKKNALPKKTAPVKEVKEEDVVAEAAPADEEATPEPEAPAEATPVEEAAPAAEETVASEPVAEEVEAPAEAAEETPAEEKTEEAEA